MIPGKNQMETKKFRVAIRVAKKTAEKIIGHLKNEVCDWNNLLVERKRMESELECCNSWLKKPPRSFQLILRHQIRHS